VYFVGEPLDVSLETLHSPGDLLGDVDAALRFRPGARDVLPRDVPVRLAVVPLGFWKLSRQLDRLTARFPRPYLDGVYVLVVAVVGLVLRGAGRRHRRGLPAGKYAPDGRGLSRRQRRVGLRAHLLQHVARHQLKVLQQHVDALELVRGGLQEVGHFVRVAHRLDDRVQLVDVLGHRRRLAHLAQALPRVVLGPADDVVEGGAAPRVRPLRGLLVVGVEPEHQVVAGLI
jgi:hypothetical protein